MEHSEMAKRARKQNQTQAERDAIEADRIAAAEGTGPYASTPPDPVMEHAVHEEQQDEEAKAESNSEPTSNIEVAEPGVVEVQDGEGEEKVPNSIVKDKFKVKYAENAAAIGDTRKQVKRSNWDWLAQQLAAACLSDKGKIEIGSFTDILDANGVDHSRWTNKNKGWEGRFRMTGRVALQKVVANAGSLKLPGGDALEAPADFIARYKTKS
jgi:hypothetical protein